MIGPAMGGYLMKAFGGISFVLMAGLIVAFIWLILVVFFLPESNTHIQAGDPSADSVPTPSAAKFKLSHLNFFGALSIVFTARSPYVTSSALPLLITAHFMTIFAVGSQGIIVLYTGIRFHWGALQAGILLSVENSGRLLALLMVMPVVVSTYRRYHVGEKARRAQERQERAKSDNDDDEVNHDDVIEEELRRDKTQDVQLNLWLTRFGLSMSVAFYLAFALVTAGRQLFAITPLQSAATLYTPAMRSLLTSIVGPTQTGAVLGAVSVVEAVGGIISPLVFNMLYSKFVYTNPSVPFFLCAAALAAGVVCLLLVRPVMEPPRTGRRGEEAA
ncbi:hypothetical protein BC938DRAFT_474506 [Jimgerdemannia flammicorona]|nr:hypothetical protein BC938DRAFT_474506 [Jimgerdemannia flammicorona]